MASSSAASETIELKKVFQQGLDLYNAIETTNDPLGSSNVQMDVKKAISLFEDATRLVSIADIFSHNENIDELATEDIQYLLLPSLLGSLATKLTVKDRKEVVDVAEVYYKDFLQRTNNYGLSDYQFKQTNNEDEKKAEKTEFQQLEMAVNTRANKIQKLKEQKELKNRIQELKSNMNNEHADDEIKRNYFISMIKLAIYDAIDELNNIEMEKPILEHMANLNRNDDKPKPKRPESKPLKPIIITRDEAQKAVYGLGYPSLPTMTVQEFYDKRVQDGIFPDPSKAPSNSNNESLSLQEAALKGINISERDEEEDKEREAMVESDDPEMLQRLREKDEYKDDHRRGWGNRYNRS